jgi:hypothetical protein
MMLLNGLLEQVLKFFSSGRFGAHLTLACRKLGCGSSLWIKIEITVRFSVLDPQSLGFLQLFPAIRLQFVHEFLGCVIESFVLSLCLSSHAVKHSGISVAGLFNAFLILGAE